MKKLAEEQEQRFDKYIKAPDYKELKPLATSWNFYEDFKMHDDEGDEIDPSIVLQEVEVARSYAHQWCSQLEDFILEMPNEEDWETSVSYMAEDSLNVAFSEDAEGWHDADIEHPAVLRARHLGELQLLKWLCKRHQLGMPKELSDRISVRESNIIRDLSTKK